MRKILFLLAGMLLAGTLMAQSPILFDINQHPAVLATVNNNSTVDLNLRAINDSTYILHTFRAAMSIEGIQYLYNKVLKQLEGSPFNKVGLGVSYSFYRVRSGVATKYLSLNGFAFLPIDGKQKISFSGSVSALNILGLNINPKVGFNFEPSLIKSDYFPVGFLAGLDYVF